MKKVKRRGFLTGAAVAGLAGAAATSFPTPAISQGLKRWQMVTTWPKNFPGLGTGAELLADMIREGTDGKLEIEVFGGGQKVKAFDSLSAVARGDFEMGHGAPYYWKDQAPAAQFLASYPFGLSAQEQNAWLQYGGGQELADAIYRGMGCKFFASGNTGTQMGGWFNKEINSLQDYRGLKMRMPGLGGEVLRAASAQPVNLPGAEIKPALASGQIDATEFVGPYNDLAFDLYKHAKYYYYPGWHEPGTTLENFINLRAWESLPRDQQAVIEAANTAVNQRVLSEFVARNNQSLNTLINDYGVVLKQFPADVLASFSVLSNQVVNDLASNDQMSRRVMDSIDLYRREALSWTSLSETAFTAARFLYSYSGR